MPLNRSRALLAIFLTGVATTAGAATIEGPQWVRIENGREISINGRLYQSQSTDRHPVALLGWPDASTFQFNVFPGDEWEDDHASSERAELSGHPSPFANDAEMWISFAVLVEEGSASDGLDSYLGQLHQFAGSQDASAEPPFLLHLHGRQLTVEGRTSPENPLVSGDPKPLVFHKEQFPWGEWVNFVFHLKLDPAGDGLVEGWRNGKRIVDYAGPLGFASTTGVYWKFGSYRNEVPTGYYGTRYANIEVGHDDLSARVESPIPVP